MKKRRGISHPKERGNYERPRSLMILRLHLLCCVLYAQRITSVQAIAHEWPFERLSEYVNDYNSRRNGERLVIRDVPMINQLTYEKGYRMYSFKPDPDGDVGSTFFTSLALAKNLRPHLNSKTSSLWITCTLVEFAGSFDTYRSPFATKIEGLNENGTTIWTVMGPQPAKLRIRQ